MDESAYTANCKLVRLNSVFRFGLVAVSDGFDKSLAGSWPVVQAVHFNFVLLCQACTAAPNANVGHQVEISLVSNAVADW